MNQNRIFLLLALLVAGGALGFVAWGDMGENLVYFWEPTQVQEAGDDAFGATIRLGGLVKEGTLEWDEGSQSLELVVTDGTHEVPVKATGAPPQMLREGIGVVVEGTMVRSAEGDFFASDRLMVKHSNEYRAPEDGVSPEELYKTLEDS